MSLLASLKSKIANCESHIAMMREDLAANEKYLYNLHVQLQATESEPFYEDEEDEGWRAAHAQELEAHQARQAHQAHQAYQEELAQLEADQAYQKELAELEEARQEELAELSLKDELVLKHPVGTKLKWVLNDETYRVAIVTKRGILQVKSVTDGAGDCHEAGCTCVPCQEIALSGGRLPPWRRGLPLKKIGFASEEEWRDSLPPYGNIISAPPPTSDAQLKKLSCDPLVAQTDPLQLKELEGRFPGGVFVLSTSKAQLEIEYFYHTILCRKKELTGTSFKDFGCVGKPNLMVEWKGLYICLSHLF